MYFPPVFMRVFVDSELPCWWRRGGEESVSEWCGRRGRKSLWGGGRKSRVRCAARAACARRVCHGGSLSPRVGGELTSQRRRRERWAGRTSLGGLCDRGGERALAGIWTRASAPSHTQKKGAATAWWVRGLVVVRGGGERVTHHHGWWRGAAAESGSVVTRAWRRPCVSLV